ncbi:hypothetical protein B0H17DRAFT_716686 [Mycena rosella]|uniref:Uncharacterized protein n=1 Tax=Mycena rosella TaxID=1033263 RepID=A0AAD7D9R8_MYCRO|nr:hypothetical protein B0H17DRAFT_716686 [Mycena rosella]
MSTPPARCGHSCTPRSHRGRSQSGHPRGLGAGARCTIARNLGTREFFTLRTRPPFARQSSTEWISRRRAPCVWTPPVISRPSFPHAPRAPLHLTGCPLRALPSSLHAGKGIFAGWYHSAAGSGRGFRLRISVLGYTNSFAPWGHAGDQRSHCGPCSLRHRAPESKLLQVTSRFGDIMTHLDRGTASTKHHSNPWSVRPRRHVYNPAPRIQPPHYPEWHGPLTARPTDRACLHCTATMWHGHVLQSARAAWAGFDPSTVPIFPHPAPATRLRRPFLGVGGALTLTSILDEINRFDRTARHTNLWALSVIVTEL